MSEARQSFEVTKENNRGKKQARRIVIDTEQKVIENYDGTKLKREFAFAEVTSHKKISETEVHMEFLTQLRSFPYKLTFNSAEEATSFITALESAVASVGDAEREAKAVALAAKKNKANQRVVSAMTFITHKIRAKGWSGSVQVTGVFPAFNIWIGAEVESLDIEAEVADEEDPTVREIEQETVDEKVVDQKELPETAETKSEEKKEGAVGKFFRQKMKGGVDRLMKEIEDMAFSMHINGMTGSVGASFGFSVFGVGMEVEIELQVTSVIAGMKLRRKTAAAGAAGAVGAAGAAAV